MNETDRPLDVESNLPTFTAMPGGVLRHECKAWLPQGILGPKARGFVNDYADRLFEASPDKVRLRIGHRRIVPGCIDPGELPMELTVRLRPIDGAMHAVTADIRPLGRLISRKRVYRRSIQLVRALRNSLMAEDLVEAKGKYLFDDDKAATSR